MAGAVINQAINIQGLALQVLGLGNWQLETASYNGANFMVAVPGLVNIDQIPFSGAYQAYQALTTPSSSQALPYGTSLGTYSATDTLKRRIVVHDIPGRDGNFIEDMGTEGEKFTLEVIFYGLGYQAVFNQALVAILNTDGSVPKKCLNELVHPTRGVMNNVKLLDYKVAHSSSICQACRLTLYFISDEIPSNSKTSISTYAALYQEIQEITSLILNLGTALNAASIAFAGTPLTLGAPYSYNSTQSGDIRNINPLIRTQLDVLNTANANLATILQTCTKLLYTFLKPGSFSDFSLDSFPLNLDLLPELFRYVNMVTSLEVSALITYYQQQANSVIAMYITYNLDVIYPGQINNIKFSVVELAKFAELLLSLSTQGTINYTVPYTLSLRQALFNVGIDFNQDITQYITDNRSVLVSTNYIPKGTILQFRRVQNG